MKSAKIVSLCVAVVLLISILASCSPTMDEVVGTYTGTYTYNGNTFSVAIILEEDGTYAKATVKNGSLNSSENGEFEIKGNKIILYSSDSVTDGGSYTEYTYNNGVLTNGGHEFTKMDK